MNEVERQFEQRAIRRGSLLFFSRETALEVVEACQAAGLKVLGLGGFYLSATTPQPSLEHSRTFSPEEDTAAAEAFLLSRAEPLWFEVICG